MINKFTKYVFLINIVDFNKGEIVEVDEWFNINLADDDTRDYFILRNVLKMKSIKIEECVIPLAEWRERQIDDILND
jgi:hypothetical protein